MTTWIDRQLPRLASEGYLVTSEPDDCYNCIAYAAGENHRWWTHIAGDEYYWPEHVSRTPAIASLVEVFAGLGYEICPDAGVEDGYEKVALYRIGDRWSHAARQLLNGMWSSKLGPDEDISHATPESLDPEFYGAIHCIMRRRQMPDQSPANPLI